MTPLDNAIADIGYTEQPPGSNHTKYGELWWPGQPSPWCMEALSVWLANGGVQLPGKGFASVGFFRNWCRDNGHLTNTALPGPNRAVVVGFEWEHDSWPDHVGLVESFDGRLHTIEGNAPGPDHTDEVARHTRDTGQVSFYAAFDFPGSGPVGTPQTPPPPAPVYPSIPVLPGWMFLTWHPNGRRGFTNHGDKVAAFQAAMVQRHGGWWPNYTMADVDGVIGPQTNDIILRFQNLLHLTVDGIVGQSTWRAAFS